MRHGRAAQLIGTATLETQPPTASRMETHLAKSAPSTLDLIVNLAKRRGFVFPSGEIYGGTRSAWDYGPLGVELKENIKR